MRYREIDIKKGGDEPRKENKIVPCNEYFYRRLSKETCQKRKRLTNPGFLEENS
jgi:hypothetical protein